ncbi:hypothetical protein ACFTSF_03715 [Kribbella sp. NPDC056951]|uniref:hypothetical protein n=1 Tax=Kribbella sp. NPDC056951 TaxID=3345978 RepID=UPI0036361A34
MIAVLTVPGSGGGVPEVRLADEPPADLTGTTQLGAGVSVGIDLADPGGWRSVAVDGWDAADRDLLEAVVGQDCIRRLNQLRAGLVSQLTTEVPVEAARSGPWRRLAVIDALDRWLQVPLDQALLDAERAVVRARAARTLRSRSLREHRNGQAVVLARRSAGELSTYLTGLANSASSLPRALYSSLSRVTSGYAGLASQVTGGPDECFDAVAEAWSRLKLAVPVGGVLKQLPTVQFGGGDSTSLSSPVDPRQVRARVVATEIRMVESRGGSAVRVVVPAFGARVPSVIADQLMVRLVDRRSGEAHAPVRLKLRSGRDAEQFGVGAPVFTQDVPLRGASADDVRADVFDPGYETSPALTDGDDELVRQRRAQFVLSEWRRAMVEIRLSRQPKTRNRRLARLTAVLNQAVPDADEPVFRGGPTRDEISRYVDAAPGTVHPWFTGTRGAGEPLVAELAAVHQAR